MKALILLSVLLSSCITHHRPYPDSATIIDGQLDWQKKFYFDRINEFKKNPIGENKIVFLGNSIIKGGGDWNDKRIMVDIVKHHFLKRKIYIRQPNSYRPWIHVVEACLSMLLIAQGLIKNPYLSGDYNIGPNTGQEKNIKWIFQINQKLSERST